MKGGIWKCSMMKNLVKKVEKGLQIVNLPHLLVQNWTYGNVLNFYNAVKPFFAFHSLNKRRRLKTIAWNNYYNILCAMKGCLVK